ncbi:MAG: NUDIX domain-containing protein [Lachnospiraceae bacterium]|nr:NUDIX domain-containing protein [Lachnospiraceae bacterium]
MKQLFSMDKQNYNPDGPVFRRPSARGIIERDGKFLVMHSRKYGYYKFPGGGIEAGEDPKEALIREVAEETGCVVIPESIEEYGSVFRRELDTDNPDGIFEQENYYYFCKVSEESVERKPEDYEIEEEFVPEWQPYLMNLVHENRVHLRRGGEPGIIERELRVMDMVDEVIRRKHYEEAEATAIRALGDEDYAGMLAYVKSVLESVETEGEGGVGVHKLEFGYSRFEHSKRVLGWSKRLYDMTPGKTGLRYADLMIATIFHDVGRAESAAKGVMSHAAAGVPITRDYLLAHGFDEERTEYIAGLVGAHSDKWRMREPDIDRNLLMLMEADYLDDMGVLGLVMDTLIVRARNEKATFYDCYNHFSRYTHPMMYDSPMVTPEGKALWNEKTELVERFMEQYKRDITIGKI